MIGHAIPPRAQGAMHDAFDPGAVQGDKGGWADGRMGGWAEQVPYAAQIARAFFTDRRGEQHRPPRFHARTDERLADRDERREATGIVGDPWALEPRAAPRDGNIQFRTENGVQMRRQDDARVM